MDIYLEIISDTPSKTKKYIHKIEVKYDKYVWFITFEETKRIQKREVERIQTTVEYHLHKWLTKLEETHLLEAMGYAVQYITCKKHNETAWKVPSRAQRIASMIIETDERIKDELINGWSKKAIEKIKNSNYRTGRAKGFLYCIIFEILLKSRKEVRYIRNVAELCKAIEEAAKEELLELERKFYQKLADKIYHQIWGTEKECTVHTIEEDFPRWEEGLTHYFGKN